MAANEQGKAQARLYITRIIWFALGLSAGWLIGVRHPEIAQQERALQSGH
jgi:hypothetical protein